MLATLAALAARNDMASLEAYAAGLTAATLTDVVIAKLAHLPPREAWAGADVPAAAGAGALAGLMQVRVLGHLAVACQPMHLCRIVKCTKLLHAASCNVADDESMWRWAFQQVQSPRPWRARRGWQVQHCLRL